jgi:hypothetical protein
LEKNIFEKNNWLHLRNLMKSFRFEKTKKSIKNMKHLLTIVCLFIITTVGAQASRGLDFVDGWVKTTKGDTLKGKVCYENTKTGERMDKIYFLDAANSKKRMGAEKLSSFGIENRVYDFVDIGDGFGMVVMQRVVEGDINLYYAWFKTAESTPQKMSYEKGVFMKKKGKDELFEVLDRKWEKAMAGYFKGDEDILDMIKKNNWTINDMDKIVTAYNKK